MSIQQPAQSFEGFSVRDARFAPLFLSYVVNGIVERLDDVEPVEHQLSIGTMSTDGTHVSLAHVAAAGVEFATSGSD